jgi:hypothetical protein
MEMMAQYHSVILSPDQLGSVGMVGLIVLAAVLIFDLKSRFKPPATGPKDDVLLRKVSFHLPAGVPEKHKPLL